MYRRMNINGSWENGKICGMENPLVDQQVFSKRSPIRPRSARKGVRKRLYSGKKGRVNRRLKSLVELNLKERKRVMAYVLNHRKNVGARILNGVITML